MHAPAGVERADEDVACCGCAILECELDGGLCVCVCVRVGFGGLLVGLEALGAVGAAGLKEVLDEAQRA